MKPKRFSLIFLVFAACHLAATNLLYAQGTGFTYQGNLQSGGHNVSGSYDMTFSVYNAQQAGELLAAPVTNMAVTVSNSLFSTMLNFGNGIFAGGSNWLEIAVRTNGTGSFTTLSPRQALTPTPYAIYSAGAGWVSASNITGTIAPGSLPVAVVTNGANGVTITGTFAGNGNSLSSLNAGALAGIVATNNLPTNLAALAQNNGAQLTNLLRFTYNVRDYGAGNGNVAQDCAAILAAFKAWTNTGGTLYFPAGFYYDTNQYTITTVGGLAYSDENFALRIKGDGAPNSIVIFYGTNETYFNINVGGGPVPNIIEGINFVAGKGGIGPAYGNVGTNNCIVDTADSGHVVWNDVKFDNWMGTAVVLDSSAAGRFNALQFWNCGTGISLNGYDDGTILSVIGYGCSNCVVDLGEPATWLGAESNRAVHGCQLSIFGAHNTNSFVTIGNGAACRISGYVEGCPAIVQIGHWGGADQSIGTVEINGLGGLEWDGQYPIKLVSPCDLLLVRNMEPFTSTNVLCTTAAADLTPMLFETANNPALVAFSDGSVLTSSARINYVNMTSASFAKVPGGVVSTYLQTPTNLSFAMQNASLDAQGHFAAHSFLGARTVSTMPGGGTYYVDLGTKYQHVKLNGSLSVALSNWGILSPTNSTDVKVWFYPISGSPSITFAGISNLFWASESGTNQAPETIPFGKVLIVDFTPEVTGPTTNVWAHCTWAPYP